jgi:hypothetical protein
MRKNYNLEMIKNMYREKFGLDRFNKLDWSRAEYKAWRLPILNLKCLIHDNFVLSPIADILNSKSGGCFSCRMPFIIDKLNINLEKFLENLTNTRGLEFVNQFDWSDVDFIARTKKMYKLKCKKHSYFFDIVPDLLYSYSHPCTKCRIENKKNKLEILKTEKMKEFKIKYLRKYGQENYNNINWDNTEYISTKSPIKNLICNKHNLPILTNTEKLITTNSSSIGGCKECSKEYRRSLHSLTLKDIQFRFLKNHGTEKYENINWSNAIYYNLNSKIDNLICKIHNESIFVSAATLLNHKGGCKFCSILWKKQDEWLDTLFVPRTNDARQVKIYTSSEKYYIVDGFNVDTNTVYEFWGDYHHGNPEVYNSTEIHKLSGKSMGELYQKTLNKRNDIIQYGFNLIEIWENEWNHISSTKRYQIPS